MDELICCECKLNKAAYPDVTFYIVKGIPYCEDCFIPESRKIAIEERLSDPDSPLARLLALFESMPEEAMERFDNELGAIMDIKRVE